MTVPLPPRAPSALLLAVLLAGCASAPRGGRDIEPVGIGQPCRAGSPNLRAAYNRPYNVHGRGYAPLREASGYDEQGLASWYGWESGSTTSMGTPFNPRALTAASRVLPLPTCVQVTNLANGRSVQVLVNDRGPFVDGRLMDLSYGAAKALDVTRTGTAQVRVVALDGRAAPPLPGAAAPEPAAVPVPSAPPLAQPEPAPAVAVPTPAEDITEQPLAPASAPAAADPLGDLIARAGAAADPAATPQPQPPAPAPAPAALDPQLPQTYLQIAAFTLEPNARATLARLRDAGIGPVEIVPGLVGGVTYYRVQIGPLAQPVADPALQRKLAALGLGNYTVVLQ